MALIKCSECEGQVSDKAKNCPHCGFDVLLCAECGGVLAELGDSCQACGYRNEAGGEQADASSAVASSGTIEGCFISKGEGCSDDSIVDSVGASYASSDLDDVDKPTNSRFDSLIRVFYNTPERLLWCWAVVFGLFGLLGCPSAMISIATGVCYGIALRKSHKLEGAQQHGWAYRLRTVGGYAGNCGITLGVVAGISARFYFSPGAGSASGPFIWFSMFGGIAFVSCAIVLVSWLISKDAGEA